GLTVCVRVVIVHSASSIAVSTKSSSCVGNSPSLMGAYPASLFTAFNHINYVQKGPHCPKEKKCSHENKE
ncbi:hypothetical protein AAGN20_27620, partial [Klebsiella pneumoniae]